MVRVDIICPLYNAEKYIEKLHLSLQMQENVFIDNIYYILTESKDRTEEYLKTYGCNYSIIKKEEFSHSLVREKVAFQSQADILVFITQDVLIEKKNWLYELVKDINGTVVAAYSRQLPKTNGIEKYIREKNYPASSFCVSKNDIDSFGLRTFFFSDASSAIKRDIFVKLNGYDGKNLPISEDMYIAYKIIMAGYKIKYCATSEVIHSHDFTLKEIYKRYKLTGKFFKENAYLDKFGTNKSGGSLAKYVFKRALQEKNIKVFLEFPFNMTVRFLGMKVGKWI